MSSSPDLSGSPAASTSESKAFLWLTALMFLIYALLAVFYNTPALSSPRLNKELLVWPVTLLLLWGYWRGYKAMASRQIPTRWVIISGLGLAVLAVLVPAFHSTDMFGYINRGWQQVHYHLNPYVYTIDDVPHWENDPMISNHWVNNPSPYGFLYLLIAKGLCWLGHGDQALTMNIFKLGNLMMHLLTATLVWWGAKRVNENANSPFAGQVRPELALFLYLWNPLVLINTLANGHNDIYMGFFVSLSALFAISGAWSLILPALMAATLIKYGAVVILPIAVLFLVKNKAWKALILGTVMAGALFGVTGLPYLPDWQHFHLKEINNNAFVSHGSLHSVFFNIYKLLEEQVFPAWSPYRETIREILKNTLLLAYLVFFAGLCWKRLRQSTYNAMNFTRDALLVMATLVCVVSLKFYPWYFGMFLPLCLFLPERDRLRHLVLVVSGAQLFAITFIGQAHLLNFLVMTGIPALYVLWKSKPQSPTPLLSLNPPLNNPSDVAASNSASL